MYRTLFSFAILCLLSIACGNKSEQSSNVANAATGANKLVAGNSLSMKINGVEWKADHNIFGAFHPKGYNRVVITAVTHVEDLSACLWYNEPETMGGSLERLEIVGGYYYAIKFETNWDWDNSVPFSQRRGVRNVTVKDCNIHHSGRDGIKLTPACSNISILNCEIHHTGAGVDISIVTRDIDGHLRSDGAHDVGADEYGSVTAVQGPSQTTGFDFKILGNPVAAQLVIEVVAEKNVETVAQVAGLDGRVWHNKSLSIVAGKSLHGFGAIYLPSGVYVLRVGGVSKALVVESARRLVLRRLKLEIHQLVVTW